MNWFHRHYCASSHWRASLERLVPWALAGAALGDHTLELGPGPGQATPMLLERCRRVTAIDPDPAAGIRRARSEDAVAMVRGDASALPFAAGTFSGVVAFTILHHLPTAARQDRVFHEARRVLRPGGIFVGMDPRAGVGLRLLHIGDICVPVPPEAVGPRLAAAGFRNVFVETRTGYFKVTATA